VFSNFRAVYEIMWEMWWSYTSHNENVIRRRKHARIQTHTQNMIVHLLPFCCNNGYTKASRCYVIQPYTVCLVLVCYWTVGVLLGCWCVTGLLVCYWTVGVLLDCWCVTGLLVCYWTVDVLLDCWCVTGLFADIWNTVWFSFQYLLTMHWCFTITTNQQVH
jgi:hypothetical protein